MYSFQPSEEQQMLTDAVAGFAAKELRPAAQELEESAQSSRALIEKGWSLGLLQASIPSAYGGFGERSALTNVLAFETLAHGDLAGAFAIGSPNLFALPILIGGSEAQKQKYLAAIAAGGWQPYSAALIEYKMDFDPDDLATTATRRGDAYVLSGEKAYVPFATDAPALIVYAKIDGQTQAFIVERGAAGLNISVERERLMSLNALPFHRIKLDQVHVAADNRVGADSGLDFEMVLASMRIASAAAALGVANAAFEYARDYAKEREAFGVKIAQKQAIAFMLAEMRTELEAMRLLTWEAAWKLDNRRADACTETYLAFTGATDMALTVADRAVQILGGHGFIREHPVERWLRNARGLSILTGLAMI